MQFSRDIIPRNFAIHVMMHIAKFFLIAKKHGLNFLCGARHYFPDFIYLQINKIVEQYYYYL